jgi:ATP-dependent Clp protease adaptor protein ClpS.
MKEKILHKDDKQRSGSETGSLILYNDDINTFDHVIKSLVEVCGHDSVQAEQCAMIVHFKGS